MTPEYTIYALWGAWWVSWTVAALWSNRTEKRAGIGAELFFRVLMVSARSCCLRFHRAATTKRRCSFRTLAMRPLALPGGVGLSASLIRGVSTEDFGCVSH